MKKIKDALLSQNFVLITFVLLGLRALAVEPGMGFAFTAIAFSGLIGYKSYLDSKVKPDVTAEIKAELAMLRTHMSSIMMKHASRPEQMNQEVKRFF